MSAEREIDGKRVEASSDAVVRALSVFEQLERRVSERLPRWEVRGSEDPARVLLEVFAEALARLQEDAESLEDRLYPRLLESLGEEPGWAAVAEGAVVFVPESGTEEPVFVPADTVVSARRIAGDPTLAFSTTADAWASTAPVVCAVAVDGDGAHPITTYPDPGWDGAAIPLFGARPEVSRYLYLGDPVLGLLRESAGVLALEWPGHPEFLAEGRWEYSVEGGWRQVRVEFEELRSGSGRRRLRMLIRGPFPGLREQRIEGGASPWLRLHLPGNSRLRTSQPRWVALQVERPNEDSNTEFVTAPRADFVSAFPRPVARILSVAGERWDEHSLAPERFQLALASANWDPAVYVGWERPLHGSIYWALARANTNLPNRPPVVAWEYSTARTFKAADVSDHTASFTRSGAVSWRAPEAWAPQELFDRRLYWLRARWTDGAYSHSPRVTALLPHAAPIRAGRVLENVVFEVTLDASGQVVLDLRRPEGDITPPSALEVKVEGRDWAAVEEFRVLRQPDGRYLVFVGPGLSGDVRLKWPRLGVGSGARGNVAPGTVRVLEDAIDGIRAVDQPLPTTGGRDGESLSQYRARVRSEWKTGERAVTQPDFTRLASAYEPAVYDTVVKRDPDAPHRLVVTMLSRERLHPATLDSLERALSHRVALGTVLEICEPLRLPVDVVASARQSVDPRPQAPPKTLVELLEGALRNSREACSGSEFECREWWRPENHDLFVRDMLECALTDERGASRLGSSGRLLSLSSWRFELRSPEDAGDLEAQGTVGASCMVVLPQVERIVFR